MENSVTYKQSCAYVDKIKDYVINELRVLQNNCLNDKNGISKIYSTKYRIKSPESVYLKTKRKTKSLDEIYDYGGLRLLCLFEEDIMDVHKDFIKLLKCKKYQLKRCSVYNWDESFNRITESISEVFDNCEFENNSRVSGYKSVHYIVKGCDPKSVWMEVQLRTLIQDVWGELEHSISYKKGSVHPHIKKSFFLLSKDLSNIESLLSYLKEVNEKENAGQEYYNRLVTPKYFLKYEKEILPTFSININLNASYQEYWNVIKSLEDIALDNDWIKVARLKLDELDEFTGHVYGKELMNNRELNYWIEMEKAFLLFCEAKHKESLDIYEKLINEYSDRYCLHFRAGELYFVLGYIEKALSSFDESERLLLVTKNIDHVNHFRIKTKLAYCYWTLGQEYIDISIREIRQAKKIYLANIDSFAESEYSKLINNICWYELEKFIISFNVYQSEQSQENLDKVNEICGLLELTYAELEEMIENSISTSNIDTAAWYNYWMYKKTSDKNFLTKSKKYAMLINQKSSQSYNSIKAHINHIQSIMNEK